MGPRTALFVVVAGCYSPRVPEGVPCESTRDCPSPQRCVLRACTVHDAPEPDAAVAIDAAEIDAAAIDAPPDAPPLACTAAGLTCAGQRPARATPQRARHAIAADPQSFASHEAPFKNDG